jgi:hypothetical protein
MFGADPNGVADSTTAFSNAIADGRGVIVTPGVYKLNTSLTPPNERAIQYFGAQLSSGAIGPSGMVGALAFGTTGHAGFMNTANPAGGTALDFNALQILPTGSTVPYEKFVGWDLLWDGDPSTQTNLHDGVARGMFAFTTPGIPNTVTPHMFAFNALCEITSGTDGGCSNEIDVSNAGSDNGNDLSTFLAKLGLAIVSDGPNAATAALFITASGGPFHDGIVINGSSIQNSAIRVGTTGATQTNVFVLDHLGNAVGTSFNSTSDERLKIDHGVGSKGLANLMAIKVHDFAFKSSPSVTQEGYFAQELYQVYPEAVHVGGDDPAADPWAVDYGRMTPLLVRSIQDQQSELQRMQEKLDAALSEIEKLKTGAK